MSEQGGGRGGRGRGKKRRSKGRGRGSEQRQSATNAPGGLQQPQEEERGATALPVGQPTQSQASAAFQQPSGGEQTQQKRAQTPKKHGQQPTPTESPRVVNQGQQAPKQPWQKPQLKQQDQTDGGFPSKPAVGPPSGAPSDAAKPKPAPVSSPIAPQQQPSKPAPKSGQPGAHGGAEPKTSPVSLPVTPQQQPSMPAPKSQPSMPAPKSQQPSMPAPKSQPPGQQQRQEAQPQIPIQKQPTNPPRSAKAAWRPPPRPDKGGTAGRPINLRVNFLPVQLPKDDIHHYDTDIKAKGKKSGEGYTRSEAPQIIQKIVEKYEKANPHGPKLVYDRNGKNIYCRTPIPGIGKDKREFSVTFTTENGKEREYTVAIQWASQVSLYNLNEALEGRLTEIPRDTLQAVEVVLRFLPSMTSIPVSQSFFSYPDGNEKDLGFGLQMWNGRFVSIRPTQWKMMLNVDTSSTAFYKGQPVLHFMCEYLDFNQIPARLNKGQSNMFRKEMKTIKIETTHVKRKQKVSGLSFKSSKEEKFPLEDGTMISVFDYFKSNYKITLKYPDLPCLKVGTKGNLLPIELCNIVQGQRKQGRLTPNQTREMIRHTAIPAPQRQQEISKVIRSSNFEQDPYLRDFGIKVGKDMAAVKGRVLDPPMLNYGPVSQPRKEMPRDGVWDMKQKAMYEPKELKEWAIISYENPRNLDERGLDFFISKLVAAGQEKQLRIHPSPCRRAIQRGYEGIGHLFGQLHKDYPNLELIIVIFPGRGSTDEYYEEVKHYGDIEYGIRTQCLKANTATRKASDMQTLANICLKINAKLGGTTSIIDKSIRSPILSRPVIIFGADVTHPSPRDDTTPSIAAVVASMDSYPNLYSAEVRIQGHRVEMITELKDMVKILLKKFRASTKASPEKIIFYRDGVSEGQFEQILIHELQAFQQACFELHPNYKPQITFIVVQKRHHARFFAENPRDQKGKSRNIPAGTVVDTQVCHPTEFDWYLCSHAGIQGTSKPAHYHVLYDDSNFKSNDLQILTNQLCHTYVRCARAVSIPAPAYYAHHVAFRARYHLKEVDRGSSEGSTASGGEGVSLQPEEMSRAVKIHDNMSSTMYFA